MGNLIYGRRNVASPSATLDVLQMKNIDKIRSVSFFSLWFDATSSFSSKSGHSFFLSKVEISFVFPVCLDGFSSKNGVKADTYTHQKKLNVLATINRSEA